MSTLQELLNGIDAPVEKTASVKKDEAHTTPATDADVEQVLKDAGVLSGDDITKTASANEGGKQMISLYDHFNSVLEENVEKTAGATEPSNEGTASETQTTEGQVETTDFEKIASSDQVQEVVDHVGAVAGEVFNELYSERMEKIAVKAGIAPDNTGAGSGAATGMFGPVGDPKVETNRPADSNKKIDTTPQHYDMDAHSNSIVGLCMKKKMISRAMHGRS